ncbi:dihydrofolate reductase family protein [Streptomyces sp. CB01881]|uniref:dihydrofolate reductase family protein n=1 Tax=Streptomyces sp. CB01881 TaxID=2078691 RepID=UPI000CDC9B3D|nr:dihydrofolate reductase family protein [Streptomyces sp. CB01881]AUY52866.1 deaminase [Streptomyces sp. CB01881]TYC70583.1 dihydrofolate reductase [Streptomyces sp. CB01881]
MRKVVLFMSISLDGYIEGPGHDIGWHRVDDELHRHLNRELAPMGGFVSGRVTHELMAGFWPTADRDPACSAPTAEFARIWREMPKTVFSRTLGHADWNATVVREVTPATVGALTAAPGGDLALSGANLAASFLRHDLIDEYHLYVHPVRLGRGTPLFPVTAGSDDLTLLETRRFPNGVVLLRHAREAAGRRGAGQAAPGSNS